MGDARRRSRQVEAVEAVGRALAARGPESGALEQVMDLLHRNLGFSHVSIYLVDGETVPARGAARLRAPDRGVRRDGRGHRPGHPEPARRARGRSRPRPGLRRRGRRRHERDLRAADVRRRAARGRQRRGEPRDARRHRPRLGPARRRPARLGARPRPRAAFAGRPGRAVPAPDRVRRVGHRQPRCGDPLSGDRGRRPAGPRLGHRRADRARPGDRSVLHPGDERRRRHDLSSVPRSGPARASRDGRSANGPRSSTSTSPAIGSPRASARRWSTARWWRSACRSSATVSSSAR